MKFNHLIGVIALSSTPIMVNAAAYEVQELPVSDLSANQFGGSIDNTGLVLTTLANPFSPPIDLSLLDVTLFPGLTDPDGAAQGDFNITDYTFLVNTFRGNAANFSTFGQKLSSTLIYQTDGTDAEYVFGFDEQRDSTNGFTFSINASLAGSANGEYIVGSSPSVFYPVPFTDSDGNDFVAVISDFLQRGFVQYQGNVNPLMPMDDTLSGFSRPTAINENLQVVGISSVAPRQVVLDGIEACNGDDVPVPLEVCLYDLEGRLTSISIASGAITQFDTRATLWQLDAQGQVVSQEAFDLTFEPAEDDTFPYSNEAQDINNNGIAVGSGPVISNEDSRFSAAMVFENSTTRRLLENDELLPNFATGINDQNLVVGYQRPVINGRPVNRLFTYDLNTEEFVSPLGFFGSSVTTPRDINNNGIVVGNAEVTGTNQGPPRTAGFMYDSQNDSFVNLNDLTACDSPYEIVAANSINDSNEIVADATIVRPLRNVRGEPILDANGDALTETTVLAVKLNPTGADAPDCGLVVDDETLVERQGAGIGGFVLLMFSALLGFRRISAK
ncbi:DUF3466 family protein [Ningiella sp. W23]|uniref:DUF3466 family protein n=1 Tax=Ningiella sp. W23 TaxID=3023715 RepID=UPI003757B6B5